MNRRTNPGKATRQIIGPDGTRRTVPAWQAQPTPRKGGLADWLAARRSPQGQCLADQQAKNGVPHG